MTNDNITDKMEKLQGATIQHGPMNRRIYVMKMGRARAETLIPALEELAEKNDYTKIIVKTPLAKAQAFLNVGYRKEAHVPGFYLGRHDALFLGKFLSRGRSKAMEAAKLAEIIELAEGKPVTEAFAPRIDDAVIRQCGPGDAAEMSRIYEKVFPTYPFPISDAEYLVETMDSHVVYFGVEVEGKLVALSSAEMDVDNSNVEMTDFATRRDWRGKGLATCLLAKMEKAMQTREIKMAYTIARAVSPGMNITFARMGYAFGGRLTNNTNISGSIESMNVWYKALAS